MKLRTPPQIEQHRSPAFEEAFCAGEKPVTVDVIEAVLSRQTDDLEPKLMWHGYDMRILASQFNARLAEIRQFLQGALDANRTWDLTDQMLAVVSCIVSRASQTGPPNARSGADNVGRRAGPVSVNLGRNAR